ATSHSGASRVQPALIEPAVEAIQSGPPWAVVLLTAGFALTTSLLASAGAKAAPLRRWRRLLHVAAVFGWTIATVLASLRWVGTSSPVSAAVRTGLVLTVAWASLPVLRDLFAGL